MSEILVTRPAPAIAVVTINRRARRNALNLSAWQALRSAFATLAGDRQVRLVVLTGTGGHFCAGADISEFARLRADASSGAAYDREVRAAYEAIRTLPQPSVAAIAGACAGGGCAIALCCDFRVLHTGARFGIPAAKLGTIYSVEECGLLYAVVGLANAKRILYGGDLFDAGMAEEMGFADAVVDDDVCASAIAFANRMSENAPLAIAGMKRILHSLAAGKVNEDRAQIEGMIREALDSADYREGAAAFLEKRPPRFSGS